MAERFSFPNSGDADDAEYFGGMIGATNMTNYVETGMNLSPDYGVPEVTVTTGKAFILETSRVAASSGFTILGVNRMFQVPQTIVALTNNAVNYIYIDPNFNTNDSPQIEVALSAPASPNLLIGTVDTTGDTFTEVNRAPTLIGRSLDLDGDLTIPGALSFDESTGDLQISGTFTEGATL